jgi:protein gp37
MAAAAGWSDLFGKVRRKKPWLDYLPRIIFVSDMSDALSVEIDFEYLRDELINAVSSQMGRRHLWLWLTKNPKRMAEFGKWLLAQGIAWPSNLIAMSSVTSQKTACRADQLMDVPSLYKGLSVEPLWEEVNIPLDGIDLCIAGGQSGDFPKKFDTSWAESLRAQCSSTHTAFFLKQLGSNAWHHGKKLTLKDGHGGDWSEWPQELRIREMPQAFYSYRSFGSINVKPVHGVCA